MVGSSITEWQVGYTLYLGGLYVGSMLVGHTEVDT